MYRTVQLKSMSGSSIPKDGYVSWTIFLTSVRAVVSMLTVADISTTKAERFIKSQLRSSF